MGVKPNMDETDYNLCQLLMIEPRIQYREMAERLGLSSQAIHRRFKKLSDDGILAGFTADISLDCLSAIRVCVWGRSKAEIIDGVIQQLCTNDSTLEVFIGSGNFIYVIGILRRVGDLESFLDHVRMAGQVLEPRVGIEGYGLVSGRKVTRGRGICGELTPLDYRIINALHRDARRTVTELSEVLGISIKTTRKRLSRLMDSGLIEISLDWRTGETGNLVGLIMIELRDGDSKEEVVWRLERTVQKHIIVGTFSNIPNTIILLTWARSIQEMGRLTDELGREKEVRSLTPHILTNKYRSHATWRDKLLVSRSSK